VRVPKGFIVCLLQVGRIKEAEKEFEKFRKKFGKDVAFEARFLYEKGLLYEGRKNYAQAISSFDTVVRKFKDSPYADDSLYHIGLAHYLGNDAPKAVEVFSSLIKEDQESEYISDACMKLGNIYYASGKLADAVYYYRKIFSSSTPEPLAADAMWNSILSYEALGLFEDALGLCHELTERFPDYEKVPRIKFKIGFFLMELRKYRNAISQFDKCLVGADRETEAEVRFHIAECYFSLGDYSRAVSTYLKIAYMNRDQILWAVTAEYKAGMTYEKMGRIGEAAKLYRRMVAHYGSQSEWGMAAAERLAEIERSSQKGK
jgi:tetratricopeptide (TPR) repeat protein